MFDAKFIVTLTGLLLAVVAICNFDNKKKKVTSKEAFGMLPSFDLRVDRVAAPSRQDASKGDFFSVPGTYQAMISPRFANMSVGANIRYNPPSMTNMASPCDPLQFGNMVSKSYTKENYHGGAPLMAPNYAAGDYKQMVSEVEGMRENYGCSGPSCNKDGTPASFHGGAPIMPASFAAGNFDQVLQKTFADSDVTTITNMLPIDTMATVNELGETIQPIVYDRFIYANRNSRLRSQGDMIRGDLPVVPCAPGWFRPSVSPNVDLQQGAMNVIGGVDNSTTRALAELIHASSGDTATTIAGVNMTSVKDVMTGQAMADVRVTAFP